MSSENFFGKILDHLKGVAKTETVIGEQFQLGEFTCVPVVKIGMGFGGGSGNSPKENESEGEGGGGGIAMEPIAFLVAKEGEISILPVSQKNKGISAIFEKVPDLMEKMMELKDKKQEKK